MELARQAGYGTGSVSTSEVTDASPAGRGLALRVWNRASPDTRNSPATQVFILRPSIVLA
ncbi:alkaline phosphatase [Pseudarthrobacter sp. R1]|uniref:alkaline phosphatase n=1 Tax=Pseudarthrobacter sp. R1 TaxID=2944934 RepID=UPI0035A86EFE